MELTRRDAVAALASLGTASGAVALGQYHDGSGNDSSKTGSTELPDDDTVRRAMTGVADVVYPSSVDGVESFVTAFLAARLQRPKHGQGIREAVATLDQRARTWYDRPVSELDPTERDQLLRGVGVDTAEEDPAGTTAERVRYYVVNELLLALYASPTGGKLVGIENPQGHPGGTESYQRGPR
jgi:hypothetical protein